MALINENLKNYINNLLPLADGDIGKIQIDSYNENIPIISNDVARLISFILSIKRPEKILEIGCAVGFSSSFMSGYLADNGHITTIERYPVMIEKAKQNINNLGLSDKISIIEGDANDVLKNLNEKYDVIFMDAGKGQYINILKDVYRLLNKGGIIIVDDILQGGSVAKDRAEIIKRNRTIHDRLNQFLKEITSNKGLDTSILTIGDGVALCYKKN